MEHLSVSLVNLVNKEPGIFVGTIDEVSIWHFALSDDESAKLAR